MGGDWNAKVESQEIHRVTEKFGLGVQNEAGQRLTVLLREHIGQSKHPLPTAQDIKDIMYTWTSPGGQYQSQIYYICSQRWRRALWSSKTGP